MLSTLDIILDPLVAATVVATAEVSARETALVAAAGVVAAASAVAHVVRAGFGAELAVLLALYSERAEELLRDNRRVELGELGDFPLGSAVLDGGGSSKEGEERDEGEGELHVDGCVWRIARGLKMWKEDLRVLKILNRGLCL